MPASSPNRHLRGALEATLRVTGPALDLLLGAGERLSGLLERRDEGYGIVRLEHDGRSAPRSLGARRRRSETA